MPMTLEDLIEACRRLADSNLATAAALNKLLPPFEHMRRLLADFKDAHELQQASLNLNVGKLNSDLAVLLKAVENAQTDVRDLQRDVTGTQHKLPPPDDRGTAERIWDKFAAAPTAIKLWGIALVLVIVAGIGVHLILAAFGIGS